MSLLIIIIIIGIGILKQRMERDRGEPSIELPKKRAVLVAVVVEIFSPSVFY